MANDVWTQERIISALTYLQIPRTTDYFDAIEDVADAVVANDSEGATKVALKIAHALKEEDPAEGTEQFSLTALDRSKTADRIARSIVANVRRWHRMYTHRPNLRTNFQNETPPGTDAEDRQTRRGAQTDGDVSGTGDGGGLDLNGLRPFSDEDSEEASESDSSSHSSSSTSGGAGGGGSGGSSSGGSGNTKSFGDFFDDPLDEFRTDDETPLRAAARNAADADSEYRPGPQRDDMEEGLELQSARHSTKSDQAERDRKAADRAASLSRNEAFFQELVRRAELENNPEHHEELRATFDDVVNDRVHSALGRIDRLAQRVAETTSQLSQGVDLTARVDQLRQQLTNSAVRAAERLLGGVDPNVPDEGDMTHPVAKERAQRQAAEAKAEAEEVLLRAAKVHAAEMQAAGEIPAGVRIEEVVEAHLQQSRLAQQAWTQELTALPEQITRHPRFREIAEQAAQAVLDRDETAARRAYNEAIDIARRLAPAEIPPTAITEGLVSGALSETVLTMRTERARQQTEHSDATPRGTAQVTTMERVDAQNRVDNQPSGDSPVRPDANTMDRLDAQNALMDLSAADLVQRISAAIDVPDMAEALRFAGTLAMLPEDEKGKFTGKSAREIVAMIIKAKQAKRNRNSGPGSDAPGRDQRPPSGGAPGPAGAAGGSGKGAEPPVTTTGPEAFEDEPQYQSAAEAGVELTRNLIKQVDWDNFCEIYAIRLTDRTALLDTALAMVKKGADSKAALNAAKDLVAACKKSGGVKVKNGKHMCAAVEHAMVSRASGKRKLSKPLRASAVGEEETA
ncbi:MAG: hypothetical protein AAF409_01020 [Pseudomonadota bacterium]